MKIGAFKCVIRGEEFAALSLLTQGLHEEASLLINEFPELADHEMSREVSRLELTLGKLSERYNVEVLVPTITCFKCSQGLEVFMLEYTHNSVDQVSFMDAYGQAVIGTGRHRLLLDAVLDTPYAFRPMRPRRVYRKVADLKLSGHAKVDVFNMGVCIPVTDDIRLLANYIRRSLAPGSAYQVTPQPLHAKAELAGGSVIRDIIF